MLLTHDHPPSHHHHHPQYHPQYHPHHSHHPSQQQQRHHHKPATHPIPMSSSDRPTLPGIASILAFAAQDPPPPLSSPESSSHPRPNATRLLQSSDPVAHALPAFASIPSFLQSHNTTHPNATPLFDSTKHHHHVHRRRSSSITIVQEQPSLESTSPSSSSGPTQNSTPNQASRTSFRDLCHPSNRPFRREPYHSTPDPQPSNPPPLNNSTAPPHTHNYHHLHQTHISHDALQRRHSDRISAPTRSQPSHYHHYHHHHHHHNHHSLLPGRSTSPNQQHPCLNSDCSRQPSFIKTAAVPTPARDDRAVKHIRRPSNASQSSSSSISGSVSVSSDFGASSLSIGSQSNLNRGAHHSSSSSSQSINIISNNNSFLTSCNDTQSSQTEPPPPWPPEEDEPPNKTFDERRGYNHPPQQRRSHDDTSGLQNHRSTSGSQSSPNQHHHQHSLSPPINSLSSRLVGGPMINNNHNNSFPPLGPQHHRYQCMEPGCGKTFSRPSSLKIHSYSHTGQKPFKCMRCDRAFSVQSNLKRHQKVHEKRSVAGPARPVSTAHPSGGLSMALMHDPGATGGRPLISEESGDEDHESDLGMYHRMEE